MTQLAREATLRAVANNRLFSSWCSDQVVLGRADVCLGIGSWRRSCRAWSANASLTIRLRRNGYLWGNDRQQWPGLLIRGGGEQKLSNDAKWDGISARVLTVKAASNNPHAIIQHGAKLSVKATNTASLIGPSGKAWSAA
jgi:hypothetical protein